jgi:hypothetical protein
MSLAHVLKALSLGVALSIAAYSSLVAEQATQMHDGQHHHGAHSHAGSTMMPAAPADRATSTEMRELHAMFHDHDRIRRTVVKLPNGIRTMTESDDPEMTATIASHVSSMLKRVESNRNPRLPMQSPTLEAIFRNRDKIKSEVTATDKGVIVVQTSSDPDTVAALQAHADAVSDLVKRGMVAAHETMMKNMAARR